MNRKVGSNQYKNRLGLSKEVQISILEIVCALLAILLFYTVVIKPMTEPKIISPLGIPVFDVVEAKEPTEPTTKNIVNFIVKTFEDEGEKVSAQALAISFCESRYNPTAYHYNTNNTGDYGLFQINQIWTHDYGTGFYHDWRENVIVAHSIYQKTHTWDAWVCNYTL